MILATNKSEKVICVNRSVSNTALWKSGAVFVKEKDAKTMDFSWEDN